MSKKHPEKEKAHAISPPLTPPLPLLTPVVTVSCRYRAAVVAAVVRGEYTTRTPPTKTGSCGPDVPQPSQSSVSASCSLRRLRPCSRSPPHVRTACHLSEFALSYRYRVVADRLLARCGPLTVPSRSVRSVRRRGGPVRRGDVVVMRWWFRHVFVCAGSLGASPTGHAT